MDGRKWYRVSYPAFHSRWRIKCFGHYFLSSQRTKEQRHRCKLQLKGRGTGLLWYLSVPVYAVWDIGQYDDWRGSWRNIITTSNFIWDKFLISMEIYSTFVCGQTFALGEDLLIEHGWAWGWPDIWSHFPHNIFRDLPISRLINVSSPDITAILLWMCAKYDSQLDAYVLREWY